MMVSINNPNPKYVFKILCSSYKRRTELCLPAQNYFLIADRCVSLKRHTFVLLIFVEESESEEYLAVKNKRTSQNPNPSEWVAEGWFE